MTRLVLFDFDGTFADTAPDMAAAANRQRQKRGLDPLPVTALRPFVSMGARGMVKAALDLEPDDAQYEAARIEFLADYEQNSTVDTVLFAGIDGLLENIRRADMRWGIVTNKYTRYAEPIVAWLNLPDCATLVCGDTVQYAKPHPLPLQHAAREAGFEPANCIYVGDDLRDIVAARAAEMPCIAAAYGYCGVEHPPHEWGADALVEHPSDIWDAVNRLISKA
jgi:2-phosphoglycolate phosphatase